MSLARDAVLLDLERRLARVGRMVSTEEVSALIADDFVEFGSSGRIWSKAELLVELPQWPPIAAQLENFNVRELVPSICLVTYKFGTTLRSSIWRLDNDRWQMIFHQGTRPGAPT